MDLILLFKQMRVKMFINYHQVPTGDVLKFGNCHVANCIPLLLVFYCAGLISEEYVCVHSRSSRSKYSKELPQKLRLSPARRKLISATCSCDLIHLVTTQSS